MPPSEQASTHVQVELTLLEHCPQQFVNALQGKSTPPVYTREGRCKYGAEYACIQHVTVTHANAKQVAGCSTSQGRRY